MKVSLLVEFEIPPHPNHSAESAAVVAEALRRFLRAHTEPATELRVSLFTPPPLAKRGDAGGSHE